MSSKAVEKWSQIHDILWETITNSEGIEILSTAEHENDWEFGVGLLIEEIMNAMGEGDVEPWTPEDRKSFQRLQLEQEIERAQRRLVELNK